jgi:hypothetical protein
MKDKVEINDEDIRDWEQFRGETPMQRALAKYDLTPDLIARRLAGELEATFQKAQVGKKTEIGVDGQIRSVEHWSYSDPMVDWVIQQNARRDLVKLWGAAPKESLGDDATPLVVKLKSGEDE